MGFFETIGEKYGQCKEKIVASVRWAEENMKGRSGAEKRAAVVAKLDEWIKLPFWLEMIDGPVLGFIVDRVCNALNILTDHGDWGALKASDAEVAAVSEISETDIRNTVRLNRGESVDERFAELCEMYNITSANLDDGTVNGASHAELTDDDAITDNFRLSEFACKCGCGKHDIDPALVNMLQAIRDAMGEPVIVTSGCRCKEHNAKVGGVENSYHLKGLAADITCRSGASKLFNVIRTLREDGRLPAIGFCQYYQGKNFVHVDCGTPRKAVFSVKA